MNNDTTTNQDIEGPPDFGYFGWRPNCFQKMNNPKVLFSTLCLAGILQGMVVNGFVSTGLTTLEKAFKFDISVTFLLMIFDIGTILTLYPICFRLNPNLRIRAIAITLIMFGIGAFIFTVPHFLLYKSYKQELMGASCYNGKIYEEAQEENLRTIVYCTFAVSFLLMGISCSCLSTIVLSLFNQSIHFQYYYAIFSGLTAVSPPLGFLINSIFLNVGYNTKNVLRIDFHNSAFIGSWWIGFLFGGTLAVIIAIILFGYSNHYPEYLKNKHTATIDHPKLLYPNFSSLKKSLIELFKVKTYILICLSNIFDACLIYNLLLYLPKITELLFGSHSSTIALNLGLALIIMAPMGTIISKASLKYQNFSDSWYYVCLLFFLPSTLLFILHCEIIPVVGIHEPYTDNRLIPSLENDCNSNSTCCHTNMVPLCYSNDNKKMEYTIYASECWAGCNPMSHESCSCLPKTGKIVDNIECQEKMLTCPMFNPYYIALPIFFFYIFMACTPMINNIIRCVNKSDQYLAVGVYWMICRLLEAIIGKTRIIVLNEWVILIGYGLHFTKQFTDINILSDILRIRPYHRLEI
ncbi:hypothetical protein A3Q56_01174 [Intoshia linei]|uniref:Solute carrier organic anion transporter family member n=1 Tax=Intoshia linei TaxID=1819745 RepID=A0A177B9Y7_9BILA|nr:hypothetical protein A3Q56_01174 [Intoshia linei]